MKQESSNLEKVVSALALFAVGVCLVVWADKVTEWIMMTLGVLALVAAAVHTVKYVRTKPEERTVTGLCGIVLVGALGVMLVSRADFIKEAISFVIGVYIILSCLLQLMAASGRSRVWPVIGVIIGVMCVMGKFIVPNALATITGVALMVYGVVYLLGLFAMEKAVSATKPKADQKKIVEAVIVKEAKAEDTKSSHKTKK